MGTGKVANKTSVKMLNATHSQCRVQQGLGGRRTSIDETELDEEINRVARRRLDPFVPMCCHWFAMEEEGHHAHEGVSGDKA